MCASSADGAESDISDCLYQHPPESDLDQTSSASSDAGYERGEQTFTISRSASDKLLFHYPRCGGKAVARHDQRVGKVL